MPAKRKKSCFILAPIGEPGSGIRKRSDNIFKFVLSPVLREAGYSEPLRADLIPSPGMITHQIIKHVTEDDLVIADLTGENPNVYYELALRHMVRRPLVQIIEAGSTIPFDLSITRTVFIDHTDLQSVDEAKVEILKQIIAVENDPKAVDNPISIATDLIALETSENPHDRILAEIKYEYNELRDDIFSLRSQIDNLGVLKLFSRILEKIQTLESSIDRVSESQHGIDNIENQLDDLKFDIEDIKKAGS